MKPQNTQEKGQVLAQTALAMVVLLAFLALALDVGQVYLKRRQLQNAADAGALEGARQMCFVLQDFSSGSRAIAEAAATNVAHANAALGTVSFPTPATQYQMTVVVDEVIPSLAASIVGQDQFHPGARATAVCGGADTVCGLWPVGFSTDQWAEIYGRGCGKSFYVWAGNNPLQDPDCSVYDCDVDDDGTDDVINSVGRSWLDFSDVVDPLFGETCAQSGCGTSELSCWIRSSSSARFTLPACIPGDNGVRAAAKDDVEFRIGDQVSIPLFDYTGCAGISCPGGTTYHVIALGCVIVEDWVQNFELPRQDGANPPWKDKVIIVRTSCGQCQTFCGSTSGIPPVPGGVNAVSLIE